jgi:galactokinase/mevalonate kinase-like predicted kinase
MYLLLRVSFVGRGLDLVIFYEKHTEAIFFGAISNMFTILDY